LKQMSKVLKGKISIRTRIMVMVLSLIVAIFLVIIAVFNVLVGEYINSNVRAQLEETVRIMGDMRNRPWVSPEGSIFFPVPSTSVPDMGKLPRGPVGKAETIVINQDYELVYPTVDMIFIRNYDEIVAISQELKKNKADLHSGEIISISAVSREYRLVISPTAENKTENRIYMVYYMDMTSLAGFASRINMVLLVVMGLGGIMAMVMTVLLSGKIARPVRELTDFAIRIGQGDFTTGDNEYRDLELAQLSDSMNKAAAQLEAYEREQKTFFQNVSHELRTPLQAIRNNAEGIQRGIINNDKSSAVIISETDRLSEMVEELLCISRIHNISPDGQWEEQDLRELLSNAAERLVRQAHKEEIQISFDFDERPVEIYCDEKFLTRAFTNLISNGIRYADSKITLVCHRHDDQIVVAVIDDGEGISPTDLPHIFDRFYKGRGGINGIGLSIVKSVVEQHHGTIEAADTHQGASFIIRFPSLPGKQSH